MIEIAASRRRGQRLDAERPALGVGQLPDVVLGALGELVALLDALEAGVEHAPRTPGTGWWPSRRARYSIRLELPLPGLYIGTRTRAERLLWPQQM